MSKFDGDTVITEYCDSVTIPEWIDGDMTLHGIDAIYEGGCASGAYMPAVVYHEARQTMSAHGDDVLQFIEDQYGDLPAVPRGESWSGIAVFYLSIAVELWASSVRDEVRAALDAANTDDDEADADE